MTFAAAAIEQETFASNRARGAIALAVAAADGVTRRTRVAESGSLRVRFPNTHDGLEAVIVNTGGGMTGGDDFSVDIDVGKGAQLVAGTAAAEKIYRSTGPDTVMNVRLSVGAGARLAWLPQETILFDRACLKRRIDVDLADDASLVMAEAVLFGPEHERIQSSVLTALDHFRAMTAARTETAMRASEKASDQATGFAKLMLGLTAALFLGVLYFVLRRRVVAPLTRMTGVVTRLARQDYAVEPPVYRHRNEH